MGYFRIFKNVNIDQKQHYNQLSTKIGQNYPQQEPIKSLATNYIAVVAEYFEKSFGQLFSG